MTETVFSVAERAFHDVSVRLFEEYFEAYQAALEDAIQSGTGVCRVHFDPEFNTLVAERLIIPKN